VAVYRKSPYLELDTKIFEKKFGSFKVPVLKVKFLKFEDEKINFSPLGPVLSLQEI
jgi:hypothetical protein